MVMKQVIGNVSSKTLPLSTIIVTVAKFVKTRLDVTVMPISSSLEDRPTLESFVARHQVY